MGFKIYFYFSSFFHVHFLPCIRPFFLFSYQIKISLHWSVDKKWKAVKATLLLSYHLCHRTLSANNRSSLQAKKITFSLCDFFFCNFFQSENTYKWKDENMKSYYVQHLTEILPKDFLRLAISCILTPAECVCNFKIIFFI